MPSAMVPRITTSGTIGGKPGPSSPCAAAVAAALDDVEVMALSAIHGLGEALTTGAAARGAAGAAAIAPVETATSETATAAAVTLRTIPVIETTHSGNRADRCVRQSSAAHSRECPGGRPGSP